jgi:hypothetical protein
MGASLKYIYPLSLLDLQPCNLLLLTYVYYYVNIPLWRHRRLREEVYG